MYRSLNEILIRENIEGEKLRILVFPFNLLSHYLRCLQLCEEIKGMHEIIFAHSTTYSKWLKEKDYTTFQYVDLDTKKIMEHATRFDFSWLDENELERVLEQQIEAIDYYRPDLVIGDASFTLRMATEYCRVKYIALLNGYMSKYYALTRRLPRAHPAFKYSEKLPSFLFDKITVVAEKIVFRLTHKPFRFLRKKYGLKSKKSLPDEMEGDFTLICDLPEIFPQENLPANYHIVGPLYYKERIEDPEIVSFISNSKKNILVTMGSTGDIQKLSWIGNREFEKYNFIVSGKNSGLKGEHVFSKEFIHNTVIMDRIDLVICHGGNGTIYQALAYGVPVLASTSIFEQEYNMQRIREMKLGDFLLTDVHDNEMIKQLEYWMQQKNNSVFQKIGSAIRAYTGSE